MTTGLITTIALTLAGFALAQPVLARDLPDLVIVAAQLEATGDCSGRKPLVTGRVRVKNIGQGRGQIFTTKEMLRSHIAARPEIRGGDRFVNSMRPGDIVSVDVRIGMGRAHSISGRHDVVLTVDPENVFKEENERNNSAVASVSLNCP